MAESRDVRLYIYNDYHQKGKGLSLIESQTFQLKDTKNVYTEKSESVDPVSGAKIVTEKTTTNVCSFDVTLTKLEYKKKVYEPCQILANLQVGVVQDRTDVKTTDTTTLADGKTNVEEKTEKGHFKPIEMIDSEKINLLKGANVELEIDNNKVAQNYFVYKVRSSYRTVSGKTSLFVELTIFSRDKLMTLDKYSRAYTARKLYTDILLEEAKKFSCVEVANHMQLLKYKETKTFNKKEYHVTNRDELRIPYIVQYNESFYQFMVRAANRYGEFLYFEDGKLNLGMQPSETNYYKKDSDNNIIVDWATEPDAVQNRYYESVVSNDITVKDYAYNYIDHNDSGDNASLYASGDERYNIDTVAMDEWTKQDLSKHNYVTQKQLWDDEVKTHAVSFVCRCLGFKEVCNFALNLFLDFAVDAYNIWQQTEGFNRQMDEQNYDDIKNDDQKSDDNYNQFVTYDGSTYLNVNMKSLTSETISNFTDKFYQAIRKKEKEIGEQAVWLDFGNYYKPFKLGDKISVDKKDYVVIQVEGSYEDSKEHLLISAIPVEQVPNDVSTSTSSDTSSTTNETPPTMEETAAITGMDAWTDTVPIPPALPDVIVREARPQVAFVVKVIDPEVLGRIRVRYPWQASDGDMSPWIRVTLPLSTSGGAVNFTPSEGDEVMVGYEHGNIDRPYAMGYLTSPFVNKVWGDSLPFDEWGATHGIKVSTGHHLTFTEGANSVDFTLGLINGPVSSFLTTFYPRGFAPWPLDNARAKDLGGGFELSDRYGFYKISGSTDKRNITIESPMGTVNMNAFQGITISAPNGDVKIEGKNVSISANNKLEITSGNNIKDHYYYKKEWQKSKSRALGASVLSGGLDALRDFRDEKLLDFSFLRCVVETFLRPVEGTLQIKSYTFVQIEAGTGGTEIPGETFRKGEASKDTFQTVDDSLNMINRSISLIYPNVKAVIEAVKSAYNDLVTATSGYKNIKDIENAIAYNDIITYALSKDGQTALDDSKFSWNNFNPSLNDNDKNNIKQKSEAVRTAALNLKAKIQEWENINLDLNNLPEAQVHKELIATKIKNLDFFGDDIKKKKADFLTNGYDKNDIIEVVDKIWQNQITVMTRYVAYQYLEDKKGAGVNTLFVTGKTFSELKDVQNNSDWWEYVKSLKDNEEKTLYKRLLSSGLEWAKENTLNVLWDNWRAWKHGYKGKILFSENGGKTASFDDNYGLKVKRNENVKAARLYDLYFQLVKM